MKMANGNSGISRIVLRCVGRPTTAIGGALASPTPEEERLPLESTEGLAPVSRGELIRLNE